MNKMLFSLLAVLSGGFSSLSAQPITTIPEDMAPIFCGIQPLLYPKSRPNYTSFSTEQSTNWSGYVAQNNLVSPDCGSVSYVYGAWTVPTIVPTQSTAYAAYWVGMDGFSNSTVEQIGTASGSLNNAQVNYAWFEMYPLGAYQITGFPVNVGDSIGASVSYIDSYTFILTLYNYTEKVYTTVPTSYTVSSTAARNSAEWIIEAPYNGGVLPLANFGKATFDNCLVEMIGVVGAINGPNWMNDALYIVDSTGTINLDTVGPLSPTGRVFSVTWENLK